MRLLELFFVRDDKIVGTYGVTSKLPRESSGLMRFNSSNSDEDDTIRMIYKIRDRFSKLDADGYYLIHNHPTGVLNFSEPDLKLTEAFIEILPRCLDHILVGVDKMKFYSTGEIISFDDYDTLSFPTNKSIKSIIAYCARFQKMRDKSLILYNDSSAGTRVMEEVDNYEFNNPEFLRYIFNQFSKFGANCAICFTEDFQLYKKLHQYQKTGIIRFSIYYNRFNNTYDTDLNTKLTDIDLTKVSKRYNV